MQSLERIVGRPLLVRSPAGSHLTDAGAAVLSWSEDVLSNADRLMAGLRSLANDVPRALRIAASQTIAESLLPGWLVSLRLLE